jgi:hypothetical protein
MAIDLAFKAGAPDYWTLLAAEPGPRWLWEFVSPVRRGEFCAPDYRSRNATLKRVVTVTEAVADTVKTISGRGRRTSEVNGRRFDLAEPRHGR